MENKINIAELLKDRPSGMELYSPLCGKCFYKYVDKGSHRDYKLIVETQKGNEIWFNEFGSYFNGFNDSECLLFPSKDQRDWSKFQRPFKDGDVCRVKTKEFEHIFIFKVSENYNYIQKYVNLSENRFYTDEDPVCHTDYVKEIRFATEEEKEKLFKAIKDNGYKWNQETKTLEKLIEPKFKVGDRIKHIVGRKEFATVVSVEGLHYNLDSKVGTSSFSISLQYEWEVVPNKFDITTLKPFESRVLVRDRDDEPWQGHFYSHYEKNWGKPYVCIGWVELNAYGKCIPYEGNEHLLGKKDDCDDFYKTWE